MIGLTVWGLGLLTIAIPGLVLLSPALLLASRVERNKIAIGKKTDLDAHLDEIAEGKMLVSQDARILLSLSA